MAYLQQRTDAWFKARRGKLTASNFGAALGVSPYMSKKKLFQVMYESSGGKCKPFDTVTNVACEWGTNNEPNALMEYMAMTGNQVEQDFFAIHPTLTWLGGSPDGLVGDDGMIEIKCPYKKELYPTIPHHYYPQVNGLLEITGRDWCDFVVWTPEEIQITRLKRNTNAFNTLLHHYTVMYGMVCSGTEPERMKGDDKRMMMAMIEEFIKQDIIHPIPPKRVSDLQLYLSEEANENEPEKRPAPDTWMDQYTCVRPEQSGQKRLCVAVEVAE